MIKITFISTLAYNYFFPGAVRQAGGHTRFYNLTRKFAALSDYDVTCVVGDFGQPDVVVKENVRLVKAPIDRPMSFFKVYNRLKNLNTDIYIDFCASPRLFLLNLLKKRTGSKYIFLVGSDNDINGKYHEDINYIFFYAYLYGLKRADAIISQVPDQLELLKKKYGLQSELILSPYFDICPKEQKETKDLILWVGRSAYYKNPDEFVDLAEKFPEQKFVMICNNSKYDHGFVKSIEKRLENISNLRFIDYVPYPEMTEYYEKTKLLVNTSIFEGFPNTFIESAMHSTPILSLNVDPNGILSEYKGGICCKGNKEFFIRSFDEFMNDKKKLHDYGNNAFKYAEKNHQLNDAVEKINSVIEKIMS